MKTRTLGFTLVEALISLGILSIVLSLVSGFLVDNQRMTSRVVSANQLSDDGRLALLRMSEVVSQAAYIYPANQNIQLPGGTTVSTGPAALAVLLPWESPYCTDRVVGSANRTLYCAFIYRLESRSPYVAVLGNSSSSTVLTERRYRWFTWTPGSIPGLSWATLTQNPAQTGVIADHVILGQSNLMNAAQLADRQSTIDNPLAITGVTTASPNALLAQVTPVIRLGQISGINTLRQQSIFARSVPRLAPPGVGQ